MAATFGQHHGPCLRIGPLAVLIATAPKGLCVGRRIGHIEQAAVEGHQPIAPIPGPFRLRRARACACPAQRARRGAQLLEWHADSSKPKAPLAPGAPPESDPGANGSIYPTP